MLISYPCGHLCYFMSSCDAIRNIRTTCCFFIYFIGAPQFFHFTSGKVTFQKVEIKARGGVKLEFIQNSFDSIPKFAIQLIRKGKKYSKNSMKINSKFVRFDSTPTIGWSQIFQMLDSFEIRSIRFENL